MPLTKDDPEIEATKSIIESYGMPIFAVDMIKDAYSTEDPFKICNLLNSLFDIDLSIEDTIYLIHYNSAPKEEKVGSCFSLSLSNIF